MTKKPVYEIRSSAYTQHCVSLHTFLYETTTQVFQSSGPDKSDLRGEKQSSCKKVKENEIILPVGKDKGGIQFKHGLTY